MVLQNPPKKEKKASRCEIVAKPCASPQSPCPRLKEKKKKKGPRERAHEKKRGLKDQKGRKISEINPPPKKNKQPPPNPQKKKIKDFQEKKAQIGRGELFRVCLGKPGVPPQGPAELGKTRGRYKKRIKRESRGVWDGSNPKQNNVQDGPGKKGGGKQAGKGGVTPQGARVSYQTIVNSLRKKARRENLKVRHERKLRGVVGRGRRVDRGTSTSFVWFSLRAPVQRRRGSRFEGKVGKRGASQKKGLQRKGVATKSRNPAARPRVRFPVRKTCFLGLREKS